MGHPEERQRRGIAVPLVILRERSDRGIAVHPRQFEQPRKTAIPRFAQDDPRTIPRCAQDDGRAALRMTRKRAVTVSPYRLMRSGRYRRPAASVGVAVCIECSVVVRLYLRPNVYRNDVAQYVVPPVGMLVGALSL